MSNIQKSGQGECHQQFPIFDTAGGEWVDIDDLPPQPRLPSFYPDPS